MLAFSAEVAEEVAELTQKWPNIPILGGFDLLTLSTSISQHSTAAVIVINDDNSVALLAPRPGAFDDVLLAGGQ